MHVQDVINGVSQFATGSMRQSIVKLGDITLIDDCYNASSASMESALRVLSQLGGANRTIAVLGDILEQGDYSEKAHRQVGGAVAQFEISKLVTVGKDAKYIANEAVSKGVTDVLSFKSNAEASQYLKNEIKPNDTILFKASRGMRFEEISNEIKLAIGE